MKRIGIRSNVMRANKIGQFKAMQRNEIYAASVACPAKITRDNRYWENTKYINILKLKIIIIIIIIIAIMPVRTMSNHAL